MFCFVMFCREEDSQGVRNSSRQWVYPPDTALANEVRARAIVRGETMGNFIDPDPLSTTSING